MGSWTNATPERTPAGVILNPGALEQVVHRRLAAPGPALARIVEAYWSVRLNRELSMPEAGSSLIPPFSVNLTHEVNTGRDHGATPVVLTGVPTKRFDVRLRGAGSVTGVKLLPGAFTLVTGAHACLLTDRTIDAREFIADEVVDAFARAVTAPLDEQPDRIDKALLPLLPDAWPPEYLRARELLAMAHDAQVTSVDMLARRADLGVRTVQREFLRWIGLGPKQVIMRMRLHDAAAALEVAGTTGNLDLATLAVRLGFYDQAHFTREFTRFVGVPPARYAAGQAQRPKQ
ncbi:AraC family transcriptional regulator [Brooklawnia sp.]|uniref:helix-turn-helix domain-containing protein n=1 Tax=Brooklawnia sp. TaxID=2699740 RepID=UPI00311D8796